MISEEWLSLARRFRFEFDYEGCISSALRGLKVTTPADPLFYVLTAEVAASGYYSYNSPDYRESGHHACEQLTLARDCPAAARHISCQNLFHYTKKLSYYAPSFRTKRVEFETPKGYYPTNPSICLWQGQMHLNVRCVNYYTDADEKVILPKDELLQTRNFLLLVDRDISRQTFLGEVRPPADLPRLNTRQPLGVEDIRLFPWGGDIWFSGTVVQANAEEMAEIMVGRIDPSPQLTMCDWQIFRSFRREPRHEKNWSPVVGSGSGVAQFIYSHDPLLFYFSGIGLSDTIFDTIIPPIAAHTWSGSTQAIPWEGGHLVMIHEKMYYPEMKFTRRWYQQRFVLYDRDWNLQKISRRFQFDNGETEFPCGMCVHPDGKRLVISYGVLDREAWLATIRVSEVNDMLYDVGER